jgi:serine/threonine protein kinase
MSGTVLSTDHKFSALRYIAPERFVGERAVTIKRPSKASDVYSLAMTSFEVCPSATNNPAT